MKSKLKRGILHYKRDFFSEKSAQSFYNKMKQMPYVLNVNLVNLPNGFRVHYIQDRKMRDEFMMLNLPNNKK